MFSFEICENLKNSYFEEHPRTAAFSSSSFKLDLVDLAVFSDLNLRLAKINLFTTYVNQSFQVSAVPLLLSYIIKLITEFCFFIHFQ